MSHINLKSILLNEQMHISDMFALEKATKDFAESLIKNKIISTHHEDLTGADTQAFEYVEGISKAIRNGVVHFMDGANKLNHR